MTLEDLFKRFYIVEIRYNPHKAFSIPVDNYLTNIMNSAGINKEDCITTDTIYEITIYPRNSQSHWNVIGPTLEWCMEKINGYYA